MSEFADFDRAEAQRREILSAEERRRREAQQARMNVAVEDRTPDDAAKALRVSRETGVPPRAVDGDFVKRHQLMLRAQQVESAATDLPPYARFMADPDNAAAAADDMQSLSEMSRNLGKSMARQRALRTTAETRAWLAQPNSSTFTRLYKLAVRGLASTRAGVQTTTGSLLASTADPIISLIGRATGINARTAAPVFQRMAASNKAIAETPIVDQQQYETLPSIGGLVRQPVRLGEVFQYILDSTAESIPGTVAAVANPSVGFASNTGNIAQQRARYDDRSDVEFLDVVKAAPAGALSTALDRFGFERIIGAEGRNALIRIGKAATAEAATEFAQGVLESTGGSVGTKRGFDAGEALQAGAAGALGSVGMSIGLRVPQEVALKTLDVAQGYKDATRLGNIVSAAEASKLRARDPELFREFVDQAAEGTGAENIYIPVEALEVYKQSEGYEALPPTVQELVDAQIDEARARAGSIVIPVGIATAELVGTKAWSAIKDDVRVTAGGLSLKETRERAAEVEKAVAEAGKEVSTEPTDDGGKTEIYSRVKAELLAQGRSPKEAETNAILRAEQAAASGARIGMTAAEYEAFHKPVTIESVDSPAQAGQAATLDQSVQDTIINIGLATNDGAGLSATEPTLIAKLDRPLTPEEANAVSEATRQEAIAQRVDGIGELHGPAADKWRTFNEAYFLPMPTDTPALEGLPANAVGPNAVARQVAIDYMAEAGLPYNPPSTYAKVDTRRAKRIAQAFDEMKHDPSDPLVRDAYAAMIEETLAQWLAIKKTGLIVEFIEGDDPYGNPTNAILDVRDNNHLWVYPTSSGFGSSDADVSDNPLLAIVEGETISGRPVQVNDIFRIVHGYFGHIKEGVGFRAGGEENAWRSHSSMYSPLARLAMTTETRGQNSWVNYGPHGETNRTAGPADTIYADQKIGLLPQWVSEQGATDYDATAMASWTDQRLADAMSSMAYPSEPDKTKGWVVRMSPQDFLDLTLSTKGQATLATMDPKQTRAFPLDVEKLANSGAFLVIARPPAEPSAWQVANGITTSGLLGGHEGRHRMTALKAAGVTSVPVMILNMDGGAVLPYQAAMTVGPQRSRLDQANNGVRPVTLQGMEPVTWNNYDRVKNLASAPSARILFQSDEQQNAAYAGITPYLTDEEIENVTTKEADRIVTIFEALPTPEEIAAVAASGRAKKGWYERSGKAIFDIFGPVDGSRFAALLAALSPQTSVENNTYTALQAWTRWTRSGRPTSREKIIEILGESVLGKRGVDSVLGSWINNSVAALATEDLSTLELSGPKVNSFMLNLVGAVDEVTNDAWMANFAGIDQTLFAKASGKKNKGAGYKAMNARMRQAAEAAKVITGEDWTPAEIQETVWSWAKTLYETRDLPGEGRSTTRILEEGDLSHDAIASTHDFAVLFTTGIYRRVLETAGYGRQVEAVSENAGGTGIDTPSGSAFDAEGTGFDRSAFEEHLRNAAQRLEDLRDKRTAKADDPNQPLLFEERSKRADGSERTGEYLKQLRAKKVQAPTGPQVAQNDDRQATLFQNPAAPRGQIALGQDRIVISLFANANMSTLIHETGHLFLERMQVDAAHPNATPELKADWKALEGWLKDQGHPIVKGVISRDAHELIARGFERYAMEGRAPSSALQGVFASMRTWLLRIYEVVQNLRSPITPELREVFDRMLATQTEIDDMRAEQIHDTEVDTFMAKEMTVEEFKAYRALSETAKHEAYDQLLFKTMAAIRRRQTERYKESERAVREEVQRAVFSEPRHVALHLLRTGKFLNDPDRPAQSVKLDREWLEDTFGADATDRLPKGTIIWKEGGVAAEDIAAMTGFGSGKEMVEALFALQQEKAARVASGDTRPVRAAQIDEQVKATLDARGESDIIEDGSIEEEAIAAVNNARQGEIIATQIRQLARRTKASPTPYAAARAWAKRKIAAGRVNDVASKSAQQRYARAAAKASRAAEKAILDGAIDEAFRQKQAQMLNHALLVEAKAAGDEVDTIVRRLDRLAKRAAMKSVDQDYMDRIHALLEDYDFRPRSQALLDERESFATWAAAQQTKGFEVHVPRRLLSAGEPYSRMAVEDLIGLNDAVASLLALGKHKQMLLDGQAEREFAAVRKSILDNLREAPGRKLPQSPINEASRRGMTARRLSLRSAVAGLLKMSTIALDLDNGNPNGPMMNLLVHRATEAENTRALLRDKVLVPLSKMYLNLSGKAFARLQEKVTIPELTWNALAEGDPRQGQAVVMTRMELLAVALNTGNASNLEKMSKGERWPVTTIQSVLERELSASDWALVQGMWDQVETLWPEIVKVERELSGVVPEKVDALPIINKHGTFRGGYWPVVYDADRSQRAENNADKSADDMFGLMSGIGTPKGHTITRTNAVGPIRFSVEDVLLRHVEQVITRIAYAAYARDVIRVIEEPSIRGAIDTKLGSEYRRQIKPWLQRQISSYVDKRGTAWWEKVFRQARVNTTIVGMGFRLSTGVAQISGLWTSAGRIGPTAVARGVKDALKGVASAMTGNGNPQVEFVYERSEQMRRRINESTREVDDVMRKLQGRHTIIDEAQHWAFWHITMVDLHVVSIPTWLGAHQKAIDEGMTDYEASRYADQAVVTSQGGARAKDLAAIQAPNSEAMKFFTMFYTPFNVLFNAQWEALRGVKRGNYTKAAQLSFFFLVASMLSDALLSGDWPEPDDEETWLEAGMEWIGRNVFFGLFSGVPVIRDAATYAERKITGQYATFGGTPIMRIGEEVIRSGQNAKSVLWDEEDVDPKMLPGAANAVGLFTGLPLGQPGTTAKFLWQYERGEVEPTTFADWYIGLGKGKMPEKDDE